MQANESQLFLVLHNIRSAYNVGAIFRTADGLGIKKIYLTGYTPSPADKIHKTQAQKMLEKTALGAEKNVLWEKIEKISNLMKRLRDKNVKIIALEQSKNSISLKNFEPEFPLALILGNETAGIPADILKKCDQTVSIPMRGKKESLNVSIAAGIAAYKILER